MKVEVDPDDVQKLDSDGRGRVYLGSEYANADGIEVAVLNDPTETQRAECAREGCSQSPHPKSDYCSEDCADRHSA